MQKLVSSMPQNSPFRRPLLHHLIQNLKKEDAKHIFSISETTYQRCLFNINEASILIASNFAHKKTKKDKKEAELKENDTFEGDKTMAAVETGDYERLNLKIRALSKQIAEKGNQENNLQEMHRTLRGETKRETGGVDEEQGREKDGRLSASHFKSLSAPHMHLVEASQFSPSTELFSSPPALPPFLPSQTLQETHTSNLPPLSSLSAPQLPSLPSLRISPTQTHPVLPSLSPHYSCPSPPLTSSHIPSPIHRTSLSSPPPPHLPKSAPYFPSLSVSSSSRALSPPLLNPLPVHNSSHFYGSQSTTNITSSRSPSPSNPPSVPPLQSGTTSFPPFMSSPVSYAHEKHMAQYHPIQPSQMATANWAVSAQFSSEADQFKEGIHVSYPKQQQQLASAIHDFISRASVQVSFPSITSHTVLGLNYFFVTIAYYIYIHYYYCYCYYYVKRRLRRDRCLCPKILFVLI